MDREPSLAAADASSADTVHDLTEGYMKALAADDLNSLYVGEYLAGQIETGEITEDIAEQVIENLGIEKIVDD